MEWKPSLCSHSEVSTALPTVSGASPMATQQSRLLCGSAFHLFSRLLASRPRPTPEIKSFLPKPCSRRLKPASIRLLPPVRTTMASSFCTGFCAGSELISFTKAHNPAPHPITARIQAMARVIFVLEVTISSWQPREFLEDGRLCRQVGDQATRNHRQQKQGCPLQRH